MSDLYKTSFVLAMEGPLKQQIFEISALFKLLDKQVDATRKTLGTLSLGNTVLKDVEKLHEHLGRLGTITGQSSQAMSANFAQATGKMVGELRSLGGISAGVAGTMGKEFKGALTGLATELGTIERRITEIQNRVRSVGASGGRSIRHGSGGGGGILDTIAMGPTHSGIFAGRNIEHGLGGLLEANGELQRQLNLYRLGGAKAADVAAARSAAFRSSVLVPDVGVAEQMKLLRELSGATGDEEGAREVLSQTAKTLSIMGAVTGRKSEEDMKRLFKFIELRGVAIDEHTHKIDVGKFGAELDYATKAMVAAQGLITSNDMLQFSKQAGSMAKGMSGEDLFTTMLAAMEDMGGARSGTSLTAVGRQFLGGIMTGGKAQRLKELGLLNEAGTETSDKGVIKVTDPTKAIVGYDVLTKQGFGAFMEQVIRPHMQAHGINDRQKQNEELYRSVGTDTARRLMGLFLSGHEQVGIVADRFRRAMSGGEGYDKIFGAGQDLQTSTKALHEAFETLKTALGDAPAVSSGLMALARGIAGLADMLKDRPALGTVTTLGGVGAGASLLGFGALQTVRGFGLPAAATQLTAAAVHLEAAAVKLGGGDLAKDMAKNAAGGGALAGLGLFGIGAGTVAAGAFAGYATAKTLPGIAEKEGPGAIDPATGEHIGSGVPQTTPWLRDWIGSWFSSPAAKEEAAKVGKQSALSTADGFKDVDFGAVGAQTASATKTAFESGNFHGAGQAAAGSLLQGFLSLFSQSVGGGGIQTASFSRGGGLDGLIQKASLDSGGGNDAGGGVDSALRAAVGNRVGSGGRSDSLGSGGDYLAVVGGKSYRAAYAAGGRERVGSWLDMFQRPVENGGLGMPLDKARAMVAMMQGESGINLNPGAIGDHGTAFGTGQWRLGRARNLMGMARAMGLNWRDPRAQQAHMRAELLGLYGKRGSYRKVYDAIMAARSGEEALALGIDRFENPAKKALAYRFRHPYLQGLRRSGAGDPAMRKETPAVSAPPKPPTVHNVSIPVHIGGHKVAHVVQKVMADSARFPTSAGGLDGYGSALPAGTTMSDSI